MKNNFLKGRAKVFLFLMLFSFIFSFNLVGAVPPQTNFGELDIEVNLFETFKQNTPHNFTFYVTNSTSLVDGATCSFDLKYKDGSGLISDPSINSISPNKYYVNADYLNFTQTGDYSAVVNCNTSSQAGGTTFGFEVTPSGFLNAQSYYWLILVLSAGIILFGFRIKDGWVAMLGTMGLYFLGIYTLFYGIVGVKDAVTTNSFAIIILALAAYLSVKIGIEIIGEA